MWAPAALGRCYNGGMGKGGRTPAAKPLAIPSVPTLPDAAQAQWRSAIATVADEFRRRAQIEFAVNVEFAEGPDDQDDLVLAWWDMERNALVLNRVALAGLRDDPLAVPHRTPGVRTTPLTAEATLDTLGVLEIIVHELFHGYQDALLTRLENGIPLRPGIDPDAGVVTSWVENLAAYIGPPVDDIGVDPHFSQPLERSARSVAAWWSDAGACSWARLESERRWLLTVQREAAQYAPALVATSVHAPRVARVSPPELEALVARAGRGRDGVIAASQLLRSVEPWQLLAAEDVSGPRGGQWGLAALEGLVTRHETASAIDRHVLRTLVHERRLRAGSALRGPAQSTDR